MSTLIEEPSHDNEDPFDDGVPPALEPLHLTKSSPLTFDSDSTDYEEYIELDELGPPPVFEFPEMQLSESDGSTVTGSLASIDNTVNVTGETVYPSEVTYSSSLSISDDEVWEGLLRRKDVSEFTAMQSDNSNRQSVLFDDNLFDIN